MGSHLYRSQSSLSLFIRLYSLVPHRREVKTLARIPSAFPQSNSLLDFLTSNADGLVKAKQLITEESWLPSVPVPETFIDSIYSTGKSVMSLGALLSLWTGPVWRRTCTVCEQKVFVFGLDGKTLNGRNAWWGHCARCGRISGSAASFGPLWRTAREALARFPVNMDITGELKETRFRKRELESQIKMTIGRNLRSLERLIQKINRGQDDLIIQKTFGEQLDDLLEKRRQLEFRIEDLQTRNDESIELAREKLEKILAL